MTRLCKDISEEDEAALTTLARSIYQDWVSFVNGFPRPAVRDYAMRRLIERGHTGDERQIDCVLFLLSLIDEEISPDEDDRLRNVAIRLRGQQSETSAISAPLENVIATEFADRLTTDGHAQRLVTRLREHLVGKV